MSDFWKEPVIDYHGWTTEALVKSLNDWRERYRTEGPFTWIVERCERIFLEIRLRDPLFENPACEAEWATPNATKVDP